MPTYDQPSFADLNDRTQYESWLLEAVYAIVDAPVLREWPDQMVYPANGQAPSLGVFARANIIIGDWRPHFLEAGAPLVFVTTFKLLDMLVEWVLGQNGLASTHRFTQKIGALKGLTVFPPIVASRDWLRERLVGLYEQLEPLRGTIIHARHFKTSDGALHISSSKGNTVGPAVTITPKELRNLSVLAVSLVRYIDGTWALDPFREKLLRRALDELTHLHGLPALGQQPPRFLTVRVYSTQQESVEVDMHRIRQDVRKMCPGQDAVFDLRVVVVTPDGGTATAYLFPWHELEVEGERLVRKTTELGSYQAEVPPDLDPARVAQDLAASPTDQRVAG